MPMTVTALTALAMDTKGCEEKGLSPQCGITLPACVDFVLIFDDASC